VSGRRSRGGGRIGERPADGRRGDGALRCRGPEVARAGLAGGGIEARELLFRQPDAHVSVEDADRRRHRAGSAHLRLRLEPDRHAFAGREAVRDERRLERDDGTAAGERVAHLGRDADHAGRSMRRNSWSPNFSNFRICRSPTSRKPRRS
jgi:hypothetical protein